MKKFLVFALLTSDLLAMNPNKVFELAYCENPTEQEVKAVYDAWDKCLEDQGKSYKIAVEEYKKNPHSDEYKKAKERCRELVTELQAYLYNELTVVSRGVSSKKKQLSKI